MEKDYLVINRAKWRTGDYSHNETGKGETSLLNKEGFMCCLGFRCNQMGIPKKELLNIGVPAMLSDKFDIPDLINTLGNDSEFANEAMSINDDSSTTPKEKEKLITNHFAKKNIIVIFKGRYPKKKV